MLSFLFKFDHDDADEENVLIKLKYFLCKFLTNHLYTFSRAFLTPGKCSMLTMVLIEYLLTIDKVIYVFIYRVK